MSTGAASSSKSSESALSRQQAAILKSREALFTKHFRPGLIQMQKDASLRAQDSAMLTSGSATVQRASKQAEANLNRGLAQRGLGQSGLAQIGSQAIQTARIGAISDVGFQAEEKQFNRRMQATQLALGASPTPTTAAPVISEAETKRAKFLGLLG